MWRRSGTIQKTIKDMQTFSGADWKFVHKFGAIARPLIDILKSTEFEEKFGRSSSKQAPEELDEKALTAFENLNQALISAPCFVIFDPTILADPSKEWGTVWIVLMQDHRQRLQPEAFLSKVMTQKQRGCPTHEQELLVWGLAPRLDGDPHGYSFQRGLCKEEGPQKTHPGIPSKTSQGRL
jgi:hypothetical protein